MTFNHIHTPVKLTTKLATPLPSPIPTIAITDSPLLFISPNGYPYSFLFPANELELNLGEFPLRVPRFAGI